MAHMGDSEFNSFLDLHLDDLPLSIFDHDQTQKLADPARSTPQSTQPVHNMAISAEESLAHTQQLFDFSLSLDHPFTLPPQPTSLPAHYAAPPTPSSVEMHPQHAQYMQHLESQQRAIMEYQIKRHEAATFTPNASPLVHPGDVPYDMNAFHAPPESYFSPLTSPALEGQTYPYQQTSTSAMATPSPVDVEMADASMRATSRVSARSKKRPNSSQADIAPARPATTNPRTHRARKSNNSTSLLDRPATVTIKSSPSQNAWVTPQQHHVSPNDSVSPEPLDNSMPPPKFPASASASNSPAIMAKSKQSKGARHGPATPASLMKMQKSRGAKATAASTAAPPPLTIDPSLPPLALPEAAASTVSPNISPADLSVSRKTPKLGPMSTPGSSGAIAATTMTASDSALNSPQTVSNPKKADPKGRNKKRGSIMNSALVSPALRPKISPSIKPLLPEGVAGSEDAHTIFLASRSNYQNLIEGTHVPGVEYPRELSTNLTSKRTSHKIAEQGRRNRINLALQEMLRLLPKSALGSATATSPAAEHAGSASPGPGSGMEDAPARDALRKRGSTSGGATGATAKAGGGGGGSGGNSKAATVESAIEYIRVLQAESAAASERAARHEREVEALRRRVREMESLCGERGVAVVAGAEAEAEAGGGADEARETKE